MAHFSSMLKNYFDGVTGILRTRSRYRCEKRGEDFSAYNEKIENIQREQNKEENEKMWSEAFNAPSLFDKIGFSGSEWVGNFIIPFELNKKPIRKRSSYRRREYK